MPIPEALQVLQLALGEAEGWRQDRFLDLELDPPASASARWITRQYERPQGQLDKVRNLSANLAMIARS